MSKIVDQAYIILIEFIRKEAQKSLPMAKGELMRIGIAAGKEIAPVEYPNIDDYIKAIKDHTNPTTQVEGEAEAHPKNIFTLPKCPFAPTIADYLTAYKKLPKEFSGVIEEFNKTSQITDNLRIGEGAIVSVFCCMHQSLRATIASKITIGGKPIALYQLACKGGDGKKALSKKWIAEVGADEKEVDKLLDKNVCCYCIKT
ncbi:MAG: hypothetical protein V1872_14310 [bacterium]